MSKLAKIRLQLSQILASFSELKTDKAILYWPTDEEIREGLEVYVLDENGEYSEAPDGEYADEAENTIVVKDGKVESITPKAEAVEETVEETVVAEETPAEEVESPSGTDEPVPDAIEEVRKEINELYDIVDKLVKKVAELDSRLGESNERLEKMSKMSAASPAEIEIETAGSTAKINKTFDAAIEGIKAALKPKNN